MFLPILLSCFLGSSLPRVADTGDPINLFLDPQVQVAREGELIEIILIARASGAPQTLVAIDAILEWDPAKLEFMGAIDGGFPWLEADFLNDPDGINTDIFDGEALYTALALPGNPPTLPFLPPDGPDIKVFFATFRAWSNGVVRLKPSAGFIGRTRVISDVPGVEVTGDISGFSQVIVSPGLPGLAPVPPGFAPDRPAPPAEQLPLLGVPSLDAGALGALALLLASGGGLLLQIKKGRVSPPR